MFEEIDARDPNPLYEQIASRVRIAVAAGELPPGHALPSVRQLATRLRVNPATVVQAYRTLEAEGFVEMRQGAGTFVKQLATERRRREQRQHAVRVVRGMLKEAARLGIDRDELVTACKRELGMDGA